MRLENSKRNREEGEWFQCDDDGRNTTECFIESDSEKRGVQTWRVDDLTNCHPRTGKVYTSHQGVNNSDR